MKIRTLFFITCIFFGCLIPKTGQPCTTFCLDKGDQLVVGKNYDEHIGDALVIVNKRNVSKTALLNPEWGEGQPASWTSKYGSVTFNNWAREIPFSGMNEAGLVVSAMGLSKTEYPEPDSRPSVTVGQWKQYQLDNFSSVEEVIASDSYLRILPSTTDPATLHFLVSDSTGDCAVIEFIGGEMVYYTKGTMPVKALTNNTYAESIEYWEKGEVPIPDPYLSVWRFITSADMVKNYDPETSGAAVDYAFNILREVALSEYVATQWSIVYDIHNLRIYFHTLDNERIRYFDLISFDFSCKTTVKVLDVKEDLSGDVSNDFIDYTYEINRNLIEKTLPDLPDEEKDIITHYPETTVCIENCFIATAAYGSSLEPQVEMLREFRARFLLDNVLGRTFVKLYNTYSPELAGFIARHSSLRAIVRLSLLPIVAISWLTLKLGLVLTMLLTILLMASISIAAAAVWRKKLNRKVKYAR